MHVTPREARDFVSEHHYTQTCSSGVARFGWEREGRLVGATVYDTGNHAMRCGVFGASHYGTVLHHHRLALAPEAPKMTASEFMAAAMRELRTQRPETRAIVTYADLCQGHDGTIYRATNALFTGIVARGNLKFVTPDGEIRPTQSLPGTWPERRARAAELGWTEKRCLGKVRYVHLLGSSREKKRSKAGLLWEVLPFSSLPNPSAPRQSLSLG